MILKTGNDKAPIENDPSKIKQNPSDPRKNPRPGYDEKNPENKKDIQDNPGSQNTG